MQAVVHECNLLVVGPWHRGSNLQMIVMPNGRVQKIVLPGLILTLVPLAGLTMEMGIVHRRAAVHVCHHTNSVQCQFRKKKSLRQCADSNGHVVARAMRISTHRAQRVGPPLATTVWAHALMPVTVTSASQQKGCQNYRSKHLRNHAVYGFHVLEQAGNVDCQVRLQCGLWRADSAKKLVDVFHYCFPLRLSL